MKGGTVQISWHGKDPILSVDFHSPSGLLATGGADRDIKLWSLHRLDKSKSLPSATFKANLSFHGSAVNVLRFSPSGELLASGADSGELVIWRISQTNEGIPSWKVWKTLRRHLKDVLDLGWSPDGAFLISGSVDNTAVIWNVATGTAEQVIEDHQHYVQGVTWDPAGKYVASLSGDRTCRIYSPQTPSKRSKKKEKSEKRLFTCHQILCKRDAAACAPCVAKVDAEGSQKQVASSKQYLFYDENMPSFFRRLSWSPDGSFLILPAGVEKLSSEVAPCSVSYIVSRSDLSRPALQLPASGKPVVAARFCPVIYSLSPQKSWKHDTKVPGVSTFKLPYRLIFAVATLNSVFIYDTEQSCPIAIFGGLHYAPITDLAWSSDARFLAVSSQDGYCTLVGFDEGDLGTPMTELPPKIASLMHCTQTASIQEHARAASSGNVPDGPLPELSQKTPHPEKDLIVQTPPLCGGTPLAYQSDSQVKPPKIRRINPKPILEDTPVTIVTRVDTSSRVQCGQNSAEVRSDVTQKQVGLAQCMANDANNDKRLNLGSALSKKASREEQEMEARSQTISMENLLRTVENDIQGDEDCSGANASFKSCQQMLGESDPGPATPLCQEHVCQGTPSFQKPRDQYADTYVRPLKFRRISPSLVPNDPEKPTTLKSTANEASSNSLSGFQSV